MRKTVYRGVDKPDQRCSKDKETSLSKCVTDYVENKINCSAMMIRSKKRKICSTLEELRQLLGVLGALAEMDEDMVYDETGCMHSCDFSVYEVAGIPK